MLAQRQLLAPGSANTFVYAGIILLFRRAVNPELLCKYAEACRTMEIKIHLFDKIVLQRHLNAEFALDIFQWEM
jgi:hypothetical protein